MFLACTLAIDNRLVPYYELCYILPYSSPQCILPRVDLGMYLGGPHGVGFPAVSAARSRKRFLQHVALV